MMPSNPRVDIFAFGCIIWELIERTLCFPGRDREIPSPKNMDKWAKLPGFES